MGRGAIVMKKYGVGILLMASLLLVTKHVVMEEIRKKAKKRTLALRQRALKIKKQKHQIKRVQRQALQKKAKL